MNLSIIDVWMSTHSALTQPLIDEATLLEARGL